MNDFNVAPVPLQVLGDEPAVAPFRLGLAAQQATVRDYILRDGGADQPAFDDGVKLGHVLIPGYVAFPVAVQQGVGGRESGQVDVIHAAEFAQEPRQVAFLGEPGQSRRVAQSHIDHALGARFPEQAEELGGRLPGEADGVEFRGAVIARSLGHRFGPKAVCGESTLTAPSLSNHLCDLISAFPVSISAFCSVVSRRRRISNYRGDTDHCSYETNEVE